MDNNTFINSVEGYHQIYIVKHGDQSNSSSLRDVFFRCGNFCYDGTVNFSFLDERKSSNGSIPNLNLADIPNVAATIQDQQDNLSFLCETNNIPIGCKYTSSLETLHDAHQHLVEEFSSDEILEKISELKPNYTWLQDENKSFFELIGDVFLPMKDVQCVCSKLHLEGLIFIVIYFEGVFYATVQDSVGEEPLLNVDFPDFSNEGEGLTLALYEKNNGSGFITWQKLSIWQLTSKSSSLICDSPDHTQELRPKNLSSPYYQHTYCVLKRKEKDKDCPNDNHEAESMRDVIFRFGSWLYSGKIELIPNLTIHDIPHVPPAIRIQQRKLAFMCDTKEMSSNNSFAAALDHFSQAHSIMKYEVSSCESALSKLATSLEKMGLSDSVATWLQGDPKQTFFEFSVCKSDANFKTMYKDIDVLATKCYDGNIVATSIYHEGSFYFSFDSSDGEEQLLDSEFHSITQGRGYMLKSYNQGTQGWQFLRNMTIWQNAETVDRELSDALKRVETEEQNDGLKTKQSNKISTNKNERKLNHENVALKEKENPELNEKDNFSQDQSQEIYQNKVLVNNIGKRDDEAREEEDASVIKKDRDRSFDEEAKDRHHKDNCKKEKKKLSAHSKEKYELLRKKQKEYFTAFQNVSDDCDDKDQSDTMKMPVSSLLNNHNHQNKGAFHHLAPLKKPSRLEGQVKKSFYNEKENCYEDDAPWDTDGRPLR